MVVLDLTGGLLTDADMKRLRTGTTEMLDGLARQYRLVAFADVPGSGVELRSRLEDLDLGPFFETVATPEDLGENLSPAAISTVAALVGTRPDEVAVIGSRAQVIERLQMAGVVALLAEPDVPVTDLPQALAWVAAISSG